MDAAVWIILAQILGCRRSGNTIAYNHVSSIVRGQVNISLSAGVSCVLIRYEGILAQFKTLCHSWICFIALAPEERIQQQHVQYCDHQRNTHIHNVGEVTVDEISHEVTTSRQENYWHHSEWELQA